MINKPTNTIHIYIDRDDVCTSPTHSYPKLLNIIKYKCNTLYCINLTL